MPKSFSEPITLSEEVISNQKQFYFNEAVETSKKQARKLSSNNDEILKTKSKRKTSNKISTTKKAKKQKRQMISGSASKLTNTPVISSPIDLIGKIVYHFTERDGKPDWYQGVVLKQVGRAVKNPKFLIQYVTVDETDKDTKVANLFDDLQNETLKLYEVEPEDFIDAKIETLYLEDDSNSETWWKGEVADIDTDESEDASNPDFFVYYDDEEDDFNDSDPEYYLEKLIELYLNCLLYTSPSPRDRG